MYLIDFYFVFFICNFFFTLLKAFLDKKTLGFYIRKPSGVEYDIAILTRLES